MSSSLIQAGPSAELTHQWASLTQ